MAKGMQAPVDGAINYIFGLYRQDLSNEEIKELKDWLANELSQKSITVIKPTDAGNDTEKRKEDVRD